MSIETFIEEAELRPETKPVVATTSLFLEHKQVVERISSEIKAYEELLKETLLIDYRKEVRHYWQGMDFHGGSNPVYHIGFGRIDGQRERRLYYQKTVTLSDDFGNEYFDTEVRPIIEAPVSMRIMLRSALHQFNESLELYLAEIHQPFLLLPVVG